MEELKKILLTSPTRTATVTLTSWSSPRSSRVDPPKSFTTRSTSPRSQSSNPQISTSLNRTTAYRLDLADRKIRAGKLQESMTMKHVIVSAVRGFASSGSSASSTTFTRHLHASVGYNRSTNIPVDSALIHESTTESTTKTICNVTRNLYKVLCKDPTLPSDLREKNPFKLSRLPWNSSVTRVRKQRYGVAIWIVLVKVSDLNRKSFNIPVISVDLIPPSHSASINLLGSIPSHSALASARLTSHISVEARHCCELSLATGSVLSCI
ncbi:hypothetical protein ACFX12_034259 [Malus domestica]